MQIKTFDIDCSIKELNTEKAMIWMAESLKSIKQT